MRKLRTETLLLTAYGKCVVLEGEYEGQEVECSNAVNDEYGLTSLATGYDAPKFLRVEFRSDGMPPIVADLSLKRRFQQVALYERS